MIFDWHPAKAEANLLKHGVDFRDALRIFRGPVLSELDERRDYGEDRIIAIGEVEGIVLRVVYTRRGQAFRIISAWKAGRRDRARYRALLAARFGGDARPDRLGPARADDG